MSNNLHDILHRQHSVGETASSIGYSRFSAIFFVGYFFYDFPTASAFLCHAVADEWRLLVEQPLPDSELAMAIIFFTPMNSSALQMRLMHAEGSRGRLSGKSRGSKCSYLLQTLSSLKVHSD